MQMQRYVCIGLCSSHTIQWKCVIPRTQLCNSADIPWSHISRCCIAHVNAMHTTQVWRRYREAKCLNFWWSYSLVILHESCTCWYRTRSIQLTPKIEVWMIITSCMQYPIWCVVVLDSDLSTNTNMRHYTTHVQRTLHGAAMMADRQG